MPNMLQLCLFFLGGGGGRGNSVNRKYLNQYGLMQCLFESEL